MPVAGPSRTKKVTFAIDDSDKEDGQTPTAAGSTSSAPSTRTSSIDVPRADLSSSSVTASSLPKTTGDSTLDTDVLEQFQKRSRSRKGKGKEVAKAADDVPNPLLPPHDSALPEAPVAGPSHKAEIVNTNFIGNGDKKIGTHTPEDAPQTTAAGPSRRSARQPRVGTRRSPRDHSATPSLHPPVEQVDWEDYAVQKGKKRAPAHSNARAPAKKKRKA
ncbi:hypothetical protein CYLTODRAFT_459506 [Cylindrobasidium torrendii FP15055 ss-10]|uniref:Uncharacterized protein n=1 Tax=Cylindrobasidium torrendii FP15055 ss-10 TaxID=1314674 RepID=A0A0D7AUG1_9AGAR|nr:hypothetical protein CYLTODRAFT_459506 [Cylindrobasidium torrendii FP15055 ss-10]